MSGGFPGGYGKGLEAVGNLLDGAFSGVDMESVHGVGKTGHLAALLKSSGLPGLPGGCTLGLAAFLCFHETLQVVGKEGTGWTVSASLELDSSMFSDLDVAASQHICIGVRRRPFGLGAAGCEIVDLFLVALGRDV